jgi:hypothetical protein
VVIDRLVLRSAQAEQDDLVPLGEPADQAGHDPATAVVGVVSWREGREEEEPASRSGGARAGAVRR